MPTPEQIARDAERFARSQPMPALGSMSRFERRLRGLAGSGHDGMHPTGYRWAQLLLSILERSVWRIDT